MPSYSDKTKNTTTITNKTKNASTVIDTLWSSSVLPWQLALPWQYTGGSTSVTWSDKTKN